MKNVPILVILAILTTPILAQKHTFQGYVEGKFVRVAPAISGQLEKIHIREGDWVTHGQPLFSLENKFEEATYDKAKANLNRSREQLENLQKSKRPEEIDIIRATLAQAKITLIHSERFLERQRKLIATHVTTEQKFEDAQADYDQAKARVNELDAQLRLAKSSAAREDEIQAAQADILANEAALRETQWSLDQKNVKAPVTGRVFEQIYRLGEWVAPGSPVITLLPLADTRIRFFVPETLLVHLKAGMSVHVAIDGYEKLLEARITYIAPQAQYTPPVIFSRDQRTKLVYMIEAEPTEDSSLNPGQPVDVEVDL